MRVFTVLVLCNDYFYTELSYLYSAWSLKKLCKILNSQMAVIEIKEFQTVQRSVHISITAVTH